MALILFLAQLLPQVVEAVRLTMGLMALLVALVEALLEMDLQAGLQQQDKEMLVAMQTVLVEKLVAVAVLVAQVAILLVLTLHLLVMVERRLFHQSQALLSNMQVAVVEAWLLALYLVMVLRAVVVVLEMAAITLRLPQLIALAVMAYQTEVLAGEAVEENLA